MDLAGIWAVIAAVSAGFFGGSVAGFIAGGITAFFRDAGLQGRIDGLDARFNRLHNSMISGKGVSSREALNERVQEALNRGLELSAMAEYQTNGKPDMAKIGAQVLKEYPDVAFDQIKKAMHGKGVIRSLGGLTKWIGQ